MDAWMDDASDNEQNVQAGEEHDDPNQLLLGDDVMERSFTLRAVISGLVIGILVNLSNTYYGLQTGVSNQMPMESGLLGFIGFKLFSRYTRIPFSAAENVLLISVATATGCMPVTAGFTGIIPALEYVIGPEENGPLRIGWENLVLLSFGLCFFGLIFASLLRDHFVVREKLPWPGPRATAHLINTLHHQSPKSSEVYHDDFDSTAVEESATDTQNGSALEEQSLIGKEDQTEWKARMNTLLHGATVSGILTIFMYFVPIFRNLPVFGHQAASQWLWTADLSPGFFGQGIITGTAIPLHMLFGAIIGWGILSPFAKHRGWAPGAVEDWATGSRGWIIWVSLAALLADASIKLTWFFLRPLWRYYLSNLDVLVNMWTGLWKKNDRGAEPHPDENEYLPVSSEIHDDSEAAQIRLPLSRKPNSRFYDALNSSRMLGLSFLASVIACTLAIHWIFGNIIPWYYTVLSIALALPMAVVGIRSLAETDYNPESALVSQLVFATLISRTDPNAIIINILSAGVAQAGASQAGDIAFDFKIGHLVGARPEAQVYGQIIGSLFGAFISCGIYKLYASQYPIPGPLFRIPSAFLDVSTARLVMGRGLPDGVAPFALGTAVIFILVTIIKMRFADRWWQQLIPGGVSFAIGIYNMPSFTIARAVGGLFYWGYCRYNKGREGNLIIFASGLVLGESIASLVNLVLKVLHSPQVGVLDVSI